MRQEKTDAKTLTRSQNEYESITGRSYLHVQYPSVVYTHPREAGERATWRARGAKPRHNVKAAYGKTSL